MTYIIHFQILHSSLNIGEYLNTNFLDHDDNKSLTCLRIILEDYKCKVRILQPLHQAKTETTQ